MHTPDSNARPERMHPAVEPKRTPRAASDVLAAMAKALSRSDAAAAQSLVDEAESDHANDVTLAAAVTRCKTLLDRNGWFEESLEAMRRDLEEDRFSAALGHFRETLNLSRGLSPLKSIVDTEVRKEVEKLLPQNWRVAEAILQESLASDPSFAAGSDLKVKLRRARESELVSHAIYQADRLMVEGRTDEARRRFSDLLSAHPGDSRLKERLQALDSPAPVDSTVSAEMTATPVVESIPKPVSLPSEAEAKTVAAPPESRAGLPKFWRTKVVILSSTWNAVKNFAAVAATTAMLAFAGFLVWHRVSQPDPKTASLARPPASRPTNLPTPADASVSVKSVAESMPPTVKTSEPPDEEAWDLVKTSNDQKIIRAFLNTYPYSSHVYRAKVKLESPEWQKVDKTSEQDIDEYIQAHPDSAHRAEARRLIAALKTKKTSPAETN